MFRARSGLPEDRDAFRLCSEILEVVGLTRRLTFFDHGRIVSSGRIRANGEPSAGRTGVRLRNVRCAPSGASRFGAILSHLSVN